MESQQSHTGKGAAYPNKHRRNYPRSKNGCLTCRGKRKKCDETKPQCKACVRSVQACVWSSDDKQDSQNNSNSDSTPPTNASSELTNRGVKKSEAKRSAARQSDPAIAELSLAMVSLVCSLIHRDIPALCMRLTIYFIVNYRIPSLPKISL